MAEENIVAGTETAPDSNTNTEIKLTAAEEKAMEQGWVPQDQWEGDPEQWRPAKEFLDRGELFKKIEDQNRTIKEFKRALDDLKGHHAKTRETEYARALQALKAQKIAALEEGDAAAVIKLDDQIDLVKDEQSKLKNVPAETQNQPNAEFTEWVDKNKWYETSQPMRAYADALGRDLAYKGLAPSAVLKEVERLVREEFPNKFSNPNRNKPGAVEGSTNKGGKGNDSYSLSDDERRVMQRFVRTGVMTEKEYIDQLKQINKGAN
ncbi:hypothetical protein UFOVP249_28 [uncultured Caudovirales phage]|uniref:Uncharacterized protein n=1 Tax=uncultured Caudovirales phage TaxID=2100421 RepID=A0A6J5LDX0_9CAUD|nr:hypothetical protein UFOVP249_28 [uncultured Caudovirales phage]